MADLSFGATNPIANMLPVYISLIGVDCTTTGATPFYTIPTGKHLIVATCTIVITDSSNVTSPGTLCCGSLPNSYTNIISTTGIPDIGPGSAASVFQMSNAQQMDDPGTVISLNIATATTADVCTADFHFTGYLI